MDAFRNTSGAGVGGGILYRGCSRLSVGFQVGHPVLKTVIGYVRRPRISVAVSPQMKPTIAAPPATDAAIASDSRRSRRSRRRGATTELYAR